MTIDEGATSRGAIGDAPIERLGHAQRRAKISGLAVPAAVGALSKWTCPSQLAVTRQESGGLDG
jgi:hypothetical protein